MTATQHILNTSDGLERLMGDASLYRKLLLRFRKDHEQTVAQLGQLLADGELATAQRKVHTLKGAAGMVGAQELHHLAGVTEAGLAASGAVQHAGLEVLQSALARVLRSMADYLDGMDAAAYAAAVASAAAADAKAVDIATRALIGRLAQLLDEGNGRAIDVLEQSATMLAASLGVAVFQEVAAAAHEFDFEAALAALVRFDPTLSA